MIYDTLKKVIKSNDTLYHAAKEVRGAIRKKEIQDNYVEFLKKDFKRKLGYDLNLKHPQTLNEKLQWLKVYYRDPIMTQCADKYAVRKLVADKIGKQYLVPEYGVYDRAEDIPLDTLPNEFVLKPNHSSGRVILCRDKSKLDWKKECKKMNGWLKENYYYQNGEWEYQNIIPRIVCEKYLGSNIRDYKWLCFHGKPELLCICIDRQVDNLKFNYYDMNFKLMPFEWVHPQYEGEVEKPEHFEEMRELATVLSQRFPHVRVDFYDIDGKIYFGELTFFHQNGMAPFKPVEWDKKLGDLLDLSKIDEKYVIGVSA